MIKNIAITALAAFSVAMLTVNGDEDHKHKHAGVAGPNGGRVITSVEPHLEFKVLENRTVKITALSEEIKPIDMGEQVVTVTAGERSNPIRMTFKKEGNVLVSDKAFPAGDDFPVVLQIKAKADAKATIEKFTMDFSPCPTCKYLEYACTCEHAHDHDHKDEKK